MENKLIKTQEVLNYIWEQITPSYKTQTSNVDKAKYDIISTNGDLCVIRKKFNEKDIRDIATTIKANNITIDDLVLKHYYLIEVRGVKQLFKKYTQIVSDFKKDNPTKLISFNVEPDNYVECVISDENNKDYHISNKCYWIEAIKTQRAKIDFLRSKAFKDILRYNFPKYVEIYDEYDAQELNNNTIQLEEIKENNKEVSNNLLEQLKESLKNGKL